MYNSIARVIGEIKNLSYATFCKLKDFVENKFPSFEKETRDNFEKVKEDSKTIIEKIDTSKTDIESKISELKELLSNQDISSELREIIDKIDSLSVLEELIRNIKFDNTDILVVKEKVEEILRVQQECCIKDGRLGVFERPVYNH